jgi:hypothetical protein
VVLLLMAAGRPDLAAQAAQPAPAPPAPQRTVINPPAAVLGQEVIGPDGKSLGRIIDVLVDQGGHPLAAVVDFGGFMGLGNRRIAVDWKNLKFDPTGQHPVAINLTPEQLKAAPEYKGADTRITVIGVPAAPDKKPD